MSFGTRKTTNRASAAGRLFRSVPLFLLPLFLLAGIACFSWICGNIAASDCGVEARQGTFGDENESLALDDATQKRAALRSNSAGSLHASVRTLRSLPRVSAQKWQAFSVALCCVAASLVPCGRSAFAFFEAKPLRSRIFLTTSLPVRAGPVAA